LKNNLKFNVTEDRMI